MNTIHKVVIVYFLDPENCDPSDPEVSVGITPYDKDDNGFDGIGNIVFLKNGTDWKLGTLYHSDELEDCPLLQELAIKLGTR